MVDTNPFADSAAVVGGFSQDERNAELSLDNNGALCLHERGLRIDHESYPEPTRRWCGLGSVRKTDLAHRIPYSHVLDANLLNGNIVINYVQPKSSNPSSRLIPKSIVFPLDASPELAQSWIERLLERGYPHDAQQRKRIKVLVNPFGGAGKAASIYTKHVEPIFRAAGCSVSVEHTTHKGHAVDLAENVDIDEFDVLACASGDGLPMECFNGLGRKKNAVEALQKIAVVQIPCGTGNAMSWNLNGTGDPSHAALAIVKGVRQAFDLASVTQGDTRTLSFLSQSLGIVAESDLGTDNIRWMGDFRFTWGFIVRLFGKTLYPIEYAVKTEIEGKDAIRKYYQQQRQKASSDSASSPDNGVRCCETNAGPGLPPLRHGTVTDPLPEGIGSGWSTVEDYPNLGNFYCGNMCYMAADAPFFPASVPNDGLLDLINIHGDISRLKAMKLLLAVKDGALFDEDVVRVRKISAVRVTPKWNHGWFSVDGESLPFAPFQIEIHQGLGTTLCQTPGLYEFAGPKVKN